MHSLRLDQWRRDSDEYCAGLLAERLSYRDVEPAIGLRGANTHWVHIDCEFFGFDNWTWEDSKRYSVKEVEI